MPENGRGIEKWVWLQNFHTRFARVCMNRTPLIEILDLPLHLPRSMTNFWIEHCPFLSLWCNGDVLASLSVVYAIETFLYTQPHSSDQCLFPSVHVSFMRPD